MTAPTTTALGPAATTAAAVQVSGVGRVFPGEGGRSVTALEHVDLTVGAGEFVILLVPVILWAVGLYILYWIIRLGVRAGIVDAWHRRDELRTDGAAPPQKTASPGTTPGEPRGPAAE